MKRAHSVVFALALVAAVFVAGCGARAGSATAGGAMDDATITARVKTAFVNDPLISIARLDVETSKGVVTLSGRVKTKDEEAQAIRLARTVKGVTDVKSALQVE